VQGWANLVHARDVRAGAFADPRPAVRRRPQHACEAELRTICRPFLDEPDAPQGALCRRIEQHPRE
jgi:hypothetical protein